MSTDHRSDTSTSSCCSISAVNPAAAGNGRENLLGGGGAGGGTDDMTTCPVMAGTPVVKAVAEAAGLFRDHDGERYHFCCAGCGPAFDADPERYARVA
ncbi:YHS domain-containing protein [Microbacterium murale]|uniref:YHS domain-containing protein n=1 Tax=Microbacterium murale TaxID=1081040 RepID=A0ABU0P815_9MICO|nr:YHS domain-containing protein [Microbacterium murale]MDQ0643470.1 YHS domain-containing protein [Microbacterium murale]